MQSELLLCSLPFHLFALCCSPASGSFASFFANEMMMFEIGDRDDGVRMIPMVIDNKQQLLVVSIEVVKIL